MKKVFLAILMVLLVAPLAMADWQATVSGWTMSPGPDLAYEEVLMDGVSQCTNILPADSKLCVFTFPSKTNQQIVIRSFDTSANFADNTIGVIGTGPNPSSGGNVTIIWVP